jgi:hypothetical protein
MSGSQVTTSGTPSSPEDGGNFRRSLQIDMKGLVGDAVGNVSPRHRISSVLHAWATCQVAAPLLMLIATSLYR